MKIAHLELGRHAYGGAEQVRYVLEGLHEDHHEHLLITPAGSDLAQWAEAAGQPVCAVRFAGEHDIAFAWRLRGLLRKRNVDLLHVHSRRGADWLGPVAAALAGIPVILSRRIDNPPDRWLRMLMRRRYARIICISEAIAGVLLQSGVPADALLTINSSVDAVAYAPPARADIGTCLTGKPFPGPVIAVIAQLIERKGHRYLIDALPSLLSKFPNLTVVFLGRGALQAQLKQAVADAGLQRHVIFAGFRADLAEFLPSVRLVVHPALMEGLGVSLLEAAAAEVPVVGFAAGGVEQAVAHEHTGLLVAPGDKVALAAAISRLLDDADLHRQMGQNARQRVLAEFSVAVMVQRHAALYDVLAGEIE
ncbi:MAG: glycosyltransferase family 4 protein [Pseudomonadota bacterium]